MKKVNNKGFMLLETLLVSAFVITVLVYLYIQFTNLKGSYDKDLKYDTVSNLHNLKQVDIFINKNYGYGDLIKDLSKNNHIELYNENKCNYEYFSDNITYCNKLMEYLNIKTLVIINNDLNEVKQELKSSNHYSTGLTNYTSHIDKELAAKSYLMIAEFNDKTFGTIKVEDVDLKAYAIGDSINFDPTTNKLCTTPVSTTGTKTGCMKWYVIKASGTNNTTVDVILDHNTTAKVAYETSGTYKEYAQATIKNQVDTDTTGWNSSLKPRLITANEIANITNTTTFDGSSSTWFYFDGTGTNKHTQASSTQGASPYKWLFDYTYDCTSYGCNTAASSTQGYWTSSPVSDYSRHAWIVYKIGDLSNNNVNIDDSFGVRPVITINKSKLN